MEDFTAGAQLSYKLNLASAAGNGVTAADITLTVSSSSITVVALIHTAGIVSAQSVAAGLSTAVASTSSQGTFMGFAIADVPAAPTIMTVSRPSPPPQQPPPAIPSTRQDVLLLQRPSPPSALSAAGVAPTRPPPAIKSTTKAPPPPLTPTSLTNDPGVASGLSNEKDGNGPGAAVTFGGGAALALVTVAVLCMCRLSRGRMVIRREKPIIATKKHEPLGSSQEAIPIREDEAQPVDSVVCVQRVRLTLPEQSFRGSIPRTASGNRICPSHSAPATPRRKSEPCPSTSAFHGLRDRVSAGLSAAAGGISPGGLASPSSWSAGLASPLTPTSRCSFQRVSAAMEPKTPELIEDYQIDFGSPQASPCLQPSPRPQSSPPAFRAPSPFDEREREAEREAELSF